MDAALLLSVLLLERPGRRDRLCIVLHAPLSAWGTGELLGHFVRAGSEFVSYHGFHVDPGHFVVTIDDVFVSR